MLITFGSTLVMPLQYAVLLGVALSLMMYIFQQSNTLRVVEWVIQEAGWPVEQPAPQQLVSNKVTVLFIYGNLFYAAGEPFEKSLPKVESAKRAVVILLMRGYEDIGSTMIGVFKRYPEELQANGGKLILAGVAPGLRDQLQRTGMLDLIGEENIVLVSEKIGESGNATLRAAEDWLARPSTKNDPSEVNN